MAVQSLMNLVGAQWWNPRVLLVGEGVLVITATVCLAINAVSDWPAAGIATLLVSQIVIAFVWHSKPEEKSYVSLNTDEYQYDTNKKPKKPLCSVGKVMLYILGSLFFLLLALVCMQPIFETVTKPLAFPNERYVTVKTAAGYSVNIRTVCMGPGFTNKSEPVTTPRFLLEVGGGSAAVDLYAI